MTLTELQTIIKNSGGGEFALDYAEELLAKIDNVARHQVPVNYWSQFTRTKEAGDFRGRVLEINLVNCFALKNVPLEYEVKQHGAPGDVDLKWQPNGIDVYIEVKLLGQDKATKKNIDDQIECCGFFEEHIEDDTAEILRIQRTIIDKTSLTKFVHPPLQNAVNLLAIDVSELQLGILDVADCILATLGPEIVGKYFGAACVRENVLGLFQGCPKPSQADWAVLIDKKLAGKPHLQEYIHGLVFLFREPKELSALSYNLKACIAWNDGLIDKDLMDCITTVFHKIVPPQGS